MTALDRARELVTELRDLIHQQAAPDHPGDSYWREIHSARRDLDKVLEEAEAEWERRTK